MNARQTPPPVRPAWITIALAGTTLAAVWIFAVCLWPSLPPIIPMHFDFSGTPDRMAEKTWPNWLLGPLAITALNVLLVTISFWIRHLARKRPSWINLPDRARFQALPPETRVRVIEPLTRILGAAPALMNMFTIYLLAGSAAVASGRWSHLPWTPLIAVVAAIFTLVLLGALQVRRAIRDAERG